MKKISPKKDSSKKNPFVFGSNPNLKKPKTDWDKVIINALKRSK